jgi:hypothetical protein
VVEPPITTEKTKDLLVTKTGQVATEWTGERMQQEILLERAQELASKRERQWRDRRGALDEVKRLAGIREPVKAGAVSQGTYRRVVGTASLRIEKLMLRREGDLLVPALLFSPERRGAPAPAVVYVDGRGKQAEAAPGGAIERLAASGRIVLAIDARGYGETADDPAANARKFLNSEFRNAVLAGHIGRPLLGQRAEDILAAVDVLAQRPDIDVSQIELVALGAAGPAALHAAVLDSRVAALSIQQSLRSWMDLMSVAQAPDMLAQVVPGALACYDLADLVRAMAPRKVEVISNP